VTVTGTLKFVKLAGGVWIVVGDDGRKYQPLDDLPEPEEGARVQLEGELARDVMTFQMAGKPFRATRVTVLPRAG